MANQLCHIIIVTVLPGRVGDIPHKGYVSGNMPAYVNCSFQTGIVMPVVLVFPIDSLAHSRLQKVWEHEHDKVEHIFLLVVVTEVEEIERQHLLKHIVQQIIIAPEK